MRRALFLAAFGLLFAVAGVSLTSAYFTDTVTLSASFVASIPDATGTASATASATATTSATVTPRPSPSVTATRTVVGTRTTTPTTTATPPDCERSAKLKFEPVTVQFTGTGPFVGSVSIENTDKHATARDVGIGLVTGQGAEFVSSIQFGNGQLWQIDGLPGFTLYAAGDIAPGAAVQVAFTIQATPAWLDETPPLTVKIGLGVASAHCVAHPGSAVGKLILHRERDDATATATTTATITATPTAPSSPTHTPMPTATATASPADSATATPTMTDTPTATPTDIATAPTATDTAS